MLEEGDQERLEEGRKGWRRSEKCGIKGDKVIWRAVEGSGGWRSPSYGGGESVEG